jgi:hypothetical protein
MHQVSVSPIPFLFVIDSPKKYVFVAGNLSQTSVDFIYKKCYVRNIGPLQNKLVHLENTGDRAFKEWYSLLC